MDGNASVNCFSRLSKTTDTSMEAFDQLPKPVREALADYPYRLYLTEAGLRTLRLIGPKAYAQKLRNQMPSAIRRSAAMAYGPDHPQAQEDA